MSLTEIDELADRVRSGDPSDREVVIVGTADNETAERVPSQVFDSVCVCDDVELGSIVSESRVSLAVAVSDVVLLVVGSSTIDIDSDPWPIDTLLVAEGRLSVTEAEVDDDTLFVAAVQEVVVDTPTELDRLIVRVNVSVSVLVLL